MLAAVIASVLSGIALSGSTPDPAPGWTAVEVESEAEKALGAARRALGRGDAERAAGHFERAAAGPRVIRAEALLGLAEIARTNGDDEALADAALAWTDVSMGTRGRTSEKPPRGAFDAKTGDLDLVALAAGVAATRAAAAQALAAEAAKWESKGVRRPEQLLSAAWARRFALDLARRSPAIHAALEDRLDPRVHAPRDAHGPTLKALASTAERALSRSDPGLAASAARILHGLGVQADFTHLRGDRPSGMARWRSKGAELLDRARSRLDAASERPWTVEELEWLAEDEGEAFTRDHSSFASPGVAVSPQSWYRVETDCGYETLLGAASTLEDHHARLVSLFGSDPFNDGSGSPRQGLVRIVPDPSGLEAEGAPFFWAGGFQAGDTTVVRHSVGTIAGLGRTLTHELTHRFDGALHPGLPAWLAEGKAVWTSEAYAFIDDHEFVDRWCNVTTLRQVRGRGHARLDVLEALLSGEPEDYRQNYSVGNALYVFLRTWDPRESRPLFADRLNEFEDDADARRRADDPLEAFVDAFCDGEGGRPSSLTGFQEMFETFLTGFDRRKPAKWIERYVTRRPRGEARDWVYDEPTWTWDWRRAEPLFGQNLARRAGLLLADHGDPDDALRALVWARAVDGYDRRIADGLVRLLGTGPSKGQPARRQALWAVQHERRGEPYLSTVADVSTESSPTRVPAVEAHLESLAEAAETLDASGLAEPAMRLRLEAVRVAAWAGLDAPVVAGTAEAALAEELEGWRDEELTGLDEDRPPELFALQDDGGFLLGRREKRTDTGRFDRRGGGKAFLRASRWMLPGAYSVRTNVRFSTGYNTFHAVLGWTSRERNVRLTITAGDWAYAVGDVDDEPTFETVRCRFDGLRTRDTGLTGSLEGGGVDLGASRTAIDLELLVEGAAVSAWIEGRYVGTYHTIDGAPIEGYVGFGTSTGAVRVAPTLVQRLDGTAPRALDGEILAAAGLDLPRGSGPPFERLANRRAILGLDGEAPSVGRLVLWTPARSKSDEIRGLDFEGQGEPDGVEVAIQGTRRSAAKLIERMERREVVQPLVVALPERFREAVDVAEFEAELAAAGAAGIAPPRVVFHSVGVTRREDERSAIDRDGRWLLFLDDADVVRELVKWTGSSALEDDRLRHWLRVFRDHGQPDRGLPAPTRDPLEDSEEEDSDSGG